MDFFKKIFSGSNSLESESDSTLGIEKSTVEYLDELDEKLLEETKESSDYIIKIWKSYIKEEFGSMIPLKHRSVLQTIKFHKWVEEQLTTIPKNLKIDFLLKSCHDIDGKMDKDWKTRDLRTVPPIRNNEEKELNQIYLCFNYDMLIIVEAIQKDLKDVDKTKL